MVWASIYKEQQPYIQVLCTNEVVSLAESTIGQKAPEQSQNMVARYPLWGTHLQSQPIA